MKRYDRAYFDKWYRDEQVNAPAEVRRKVFFAIATAEYFLQHSIRSVLDVGCGEAQWLPHLRTLRPRIRYLGLDASAYAVMQLGTTRNLRRASFGGLPALQLTKKLDLIVCPAARHYG